MTKEKIIKLSIFICAILGMSSILVGSTYSLFSTNMKGNKINEVSASGITLKYTEPQESLVTDILTDAYGINNSNYFEFKVTAQSKGKSKLNYNIYLEESEGNTIPIENIKVFITDSNNNPINKDYINSEEKLCYNYKTFESFTKLNENYTNCEIDTNNLQADETIYLMKDRYEKNIDTTTYQCKKYTKSSGNIIEENTDISNCEYGYIYNGKPIIPNTYNDLYKNMGIKNVLLTDSFIFDNQTEESRTYRIRIWANGLENTLEESTTEDNTQTASSDTLTFKYRINVYAKQVELGE